MSILKETLKNAPDLSLIKGEKNFGPGITFIPLDQPLLPFLATQLAILNHHSLDDYLKTLVILPTRRTVKELKHTLTRSLMQQAVILPRIVAVNDLDPPHAVLSQPVMSPLKRLSLVLEILGRLSYKMNTARFPLAIRLLSFLDDLYAQEADFNGIDDIIPAEFAAHWQVTSDFLMLFLREWEVCLKNNGYQDPTAWHIMVLKTLNRQWQDSPPDYPIFGAALDTFIPAAAHLMKTISSLPKGYLILAGLPLEEEKEFLPTHPSYLLKQFLTGGLAPALVPLSPRTRLLLEIMDSTPLQERSLDELSLGTIKVLSCPNLTYEAQSVALFARKFLEECEGVVAIITPDETLTERIQEELKRWHIIVDRASGSPLSQTAIGRLILETLSLKSIFDEPLNFLSVFKNPKVFFGFDSPITLKRLIRRLEKDLLRRHDAKPCGLEEDLKLFIERYTAAISPLLNLQSPSKKPLETYLRCHLTLLETLAMDQKGKCSLWEDEASTEAAMCLKTLMADRTSFEPLNFFEYQTLVAHILTQGMIRNPLCHPRLRLLNPLQAVGISLDAVILCGLNEGIWPEGAASNPWLNRDMSLKIGLHDPQILIGRAASLFCHAMSSPHVILTYARRRNGDLMAPSRWILRLEALAMVLDQRIEIDARDSLERWHNHLDRPQEMILLKEPLPCPPSTHRPQRFSVSELVRLFQNPYHIYARSILKLTPLGSLDSPLDEASYGSWVHRILELAIPQGLTDKEEFLTLGRTLYAPALTPEAIFLREISFSQGLDWLLPTLKEQAQRGTPEALETLLSVTLKVGETPFEIVGKVDRIDRLHTGKYELIDYKTGTAPSRTEVEKGKALQLPLLGWLWEKTYPDKEIETLTYISIGSKQCLRIEKEQLVETTEAMLLALLKTYTHPETPYHINPLDSLQNPFNIYHHLERTSEWLLNRY